MKKKAGIVICSRLDSSRVPKKAMAMIAGRPLIEHLVKRCALSGLKVIVAVPENEEREYRFLKTALGSKVSIFAGYADDPLARLSAAAKDAGLDVVVRVCHDKVLVDPENIARAVEDFDPETIEYAFSPHFTDGSAFEVLEAAALHRARARFARLEHVSYAMRVVTDKIAYIAVPKQNRSRHRLLVDFPEDLEVLRAVFMRAGSNVTLVEAIALMNREGWISDLNRQPELTVYTCAFNAEKWIEKAMGSVAAQRGFKRLQYLLIDDCSSDSTGAIMARFSGLYKNASYVRNDRNMGIASSSNAAIDLARGRYVVRLDADDYFPHADALVSLLSSIEERDLDAVYPDNYFGTTGVIQSGADKHHVGGAIFKTRALNHLRFTDGLRGLEGYDLFTRARGMLKIGYLERPIFFYRQTKGSMSKTNLAQRAEIKRSIDERGP